MNFQKIAENSSVLVNLGFPYHKVIFIMAFHYFRFQCREDSKVEGVEANEEQGCYKNAAFDPHLHVACVL